MCLHEFRQHEIQLQDGEKHYNGAYQRVEKEFYGGVEAVRSSPDTDDEVHRHEHHFPENIEEEEIERSKYTEHPRLQQKQENVVLLLPLADVIPGAQRGDRTEQRGEYDQNQRHPIDAHLISHTN